eukprot:4685815-Amphidinium_carterae.1
MKGITVSGVSGTKNKHSLQGALQNKSLDTKEADSIRTLSSDHQTINKLQMVMSAMTMINGRRVSVETVNGQLGLPLQRYLGPRALSKFSRKELF